jgi:uncharacterized phage protein (TIGR01671 family)
MKNREIKFRAWNLDSEKMILWDKLASLRYAIENERTVMMQYTGLKDKNGKEIYEGDIIKQGDNPECWFAPRAVEFKNGSWMGGEIRIYVDQDKYDYQGRVNQNEWEVIGNIWENPELIK